MVVLLIMFCLVWKKGNLSYGLKCFKNWKMFDFFWVGCFFFIRLLKYISDFDGQCCIFVEWYDYRCFYFCVNIILVYQYFFCWLCSLNNVRIMCFKKVFCYFLSWGFFDFIKELILSLRKIGFIIVLFMYMIQIGFNCYKCVE